MRHRLISPGGEKYLPVAESAIRKLKKLGLPYADQAFVVDGYTIRLRVEPEHEYIRIDGSCSLVLDHGVVDLITTHFSRDDRYDPGVLLPTTSSKAYDSTFVSTNGGLVNRGPTGQFSGKISVSGSGAIGRIEYSGTGSFFPRADANPSPPPSWLFRKEDTALFIKKVLATTCPPSVFTGRCRMYVQALYGTHLYSAWRGENAKMFMPYAATESYAAPQLKLQTFNKPKGDEPPYVILSTSSGIYLDPTTGHHWLFNAAANRVDIYRLRASPCGEKLRKFIKHGTRAFGSITEEDRERVECYILSRSLPDTSTWVRHSHSVKFGFSLGYGWHWNWSGTKAVIVNNDWSVIPPEVLINQKFCMESTMCGVTVTPASRDDQTGEVTRWHVSGATMEGPSKWSVTRDTKTIVFPSWSGLGLEKLTPYYTKLFDCNAPFYAFFIKDELQVCRVSSSHVAEAPAYFTFSPEYFVQVRKTDLGDYVIDGAYTTSGLGGGSYEYKHREVDGYRITEIQIGPVSSPKLYTDRAEYWTALTVYDKTLDHVDAHGQIGMGWLGGTYAVGKPSFTGSGFVWDHITLPEIVDDVRKNQATYRRSFKDTVYYYKYLEAYDSITRNYGNISEIIIPKYDAEAVYMHSESQIVDIRPALYGAYKVGPYITRTEFILTKNEYRLYDPGTPENPADDYYVPTGKQTEQPERTIEKYSASINNTLQDVRTSDAEVLLRPDTSETSVNDVWVLLCRAGVVEPRHDVFVPYEFHDKFSDFVPLSYITLTSARFQNTGVISILCDPMGLAFTPNPAHEFVFVGCV